VSADRTKSYDRIARLLVGADEYLAKPVAPDELLIWNRAPAAPAGPVTPSVAAQLTGRERQVLSAQAVALAYRRELVSAHA
jgi:DNA-binding response OmpR family regulator